MSPSTTDVIVIGAGASGLAAAIAAARAGVSVLVVEKNHVPGRKILSTGSGKCNFSNKNISLSAYHASNPDFLKKTFATLPPAEVHAFFDGLGLLRSEKDGGRIFPRSMKAQTVLGALLNELEALKVPVVTLTEALAVNRKKDVFLVESVKVVPGWEKRAQPNKDSRNSEEKIVYRGVRVILAAGGAAYPQIGGSGKGYALIGSLGHSVTAPAPALVPLKINGPVLKELNGVRLDATLSLKVDGKYISESRGEILFTDYGVSGPAVLDLSRSALRSLSAGQVTLEADFFPDYPAKVFGEFLLSRNSAFAGRPFRHWACGLLNEKMMRAAAGRCGIDWNAPVGPGIDRLAETLKSFSIEITGAPGFEDAMISTGGCNCAEINPETFESKKIKGLYVTGELLDIDGDSGGFNLHLAWTSGLLAGRHAAVAAMRQP